MNEIMNAFSKTKEIMENNQTIKLINSPFVNYSIKVNNFDLRMNLAYIDIVVKRYQTIALIENICVSIIDNETLKLDEKEIKNLKQRFDTSSYKFPLIKFSIVKKQK